LAAWRDKKHDLAQRRKGRQEKPEKLPKDIYKFESMTVFSQRLAA
jgi:hypothetical protein